jgi:hypothetical protein
MQLGGCIGMLSRALELEKKDSSPSRKHDRELTDGKACWRGLVMSHEFATSAL